MLGQRFRSGSDGDDVMTVPPEAVYQRLRFLVPALDHKDTHSSPPFESPFDRLSEGG
ncbi:hypothetical protein SGFS_016380 [Streptomyces graminofaciens]|uniref:Uncharacterized protein n=1 Tax=Streptomyces graminofaciens TaxID=68212 RepID=A0ABN5VB00_9ACTN|nr:hypothetical protein SGFS_016380 [Streptomyces graminofaciens]